MSGDGGRFGGDYNKLTNGLNINPRNIRRMIKKHSSDPYLVEKLKEELLKYKQEKI